MEISKRTLAGFTVVDLSGDLLSDTTLELEKQIRPLAGENLKLVINLSQVPTIGSHALSIFIRLWKKISARKGLLFIIAPPKLTRKLEAMKIGGIIKILPTEQALLDMEKTKKPEKIRTDIESSRGFKIVRVREFNELPDASRDLEKILMELLNAGDTRLALDLSKVQHVYTDLLGAFVASGKKIKDKGGDFCLFGLSDDLLVMVKCVGLDYIIRIFKSEEEFNRYRAAGPDAK